MGWMERIFGKDTAEQAKGSGLAQLSLDAFSAAPPANPAAASSADSAAAGGEEIPPERLGLNGEYDQSGLAKRVTLAFDKDAQAAAIETVWVAQTGGTVVLKGSVPDQAMLNHLVAIASKVYGATGVETDQVTVG